jgi:SAM-dependent methyltransferase
VRAQVVDILDISFEEDSFDIIIANSMLYHVADMDLALRNIHSILRFGGVFYATTFGRLGLIHTINRAMFEMGLSDSKEISDISFSLENGEELLWKQFLRVKKVTYDANLEVSEISDLVDYIFSMSSMSHVDGSNREKVSAYFESKKDGKGLLQIPQTYGMFIAST